MSLAESWKGSLQLSKFSIFSHETKTEFFFQHFRTEQENKKYKDIYLHKDMNDIKLKSRIQILLHCICNCDTTVSVIIFISVFFLTEYLHFKTISTPCKLPTYYISLVFFFTTQ